MPTPRKAPIRPRIGFLIALTLSLAAPLRASELSDKYMQLGGPSGFLGPPVTAELPIGDGTGTYQIYAHGAINWSPATGAHEVHGAILEKWSALGAAHGFLGYPLTDESPTPDGVGRYNLFQGGSIHWSPATGAFETHGLIRDKWARLGWETGFLGYPVTDELTTPDGIGRYNHFQGGSIYWTPSTGAFEVHGLIREKWASLGWELGYLGYPWTDEQGTPDGIGRYNHFQGGSIYWTPSGGAFAVRGEIREKWASMGWERSDLGYPRTDTMSNLDPNSRETGRFNLFQGGGIWWAPGLGAHPVIDVLDDWTRLGRETGCFGYPTEDPVIECVQLYPIPGGGGPKRCKVRQNFEGGFISIEETNLGVATRTSCDENLRKARVTIPDVSGPAGGTVTIPIEINGNIRTVQSMKSFLIHDTTLKFSGSGAVTLGPILQGGQVFAGSASPTSFRVDVAGVQERSGPGLLMRVTGRIAPNAVPGPHVLKLDQVSLMDARGDAVPNLEITVGTFTVTTGASSAPKPGDLTGDEKVTVADALMALLIAVGLKTDATAEERRAGDLNGNGTVSVGEVIAILRAAAGVGNLDEGPG